MKMNFLLRALLFFVLFCSQVNEAMAVLPGALDCRTVATMVSAAVGTLGLYYWTTPDAAKPELEDLDVRTFLPVDDAEDLPVLCAKAEILRAIKDGMGVIQVKKKNGSGIEDRLYKICRGIPEEIKNQRNPLFIYSSGVYNSGPSAYCVYREMRGGSITGPCVVFEYCTDTRRAFNFCQEQDQHCLKLVHDELLVKAPEAQIVLFGICKGASNALRFVAQKKANGERVDHIKALIAESPIVSWEQALSSSPILRALSRLSLPNYHPDKLKTILMDTSFPETCRVLIGSTPGDEFSQLAHVQILKKHLEGCGATVDHFICEGEDALIRHGKIGAAPSWQKRVNLFLEEQKLS